MAHTAALAVLNAADASPVEAQVAAALAAVRGGNAGLAHAALATLQPAMVGESRRRALVGMLHLQIGAAADALRWFDAALEADPMQPDALLHRATALQSLGRDEEALASYDAALAGSATPADASTLLNRGLVLRRLGRTAEAAAATDAALRLRPADPAALRARAHLHADAGAWDDALATLDAALAAAPRDKNLLVDRGTFLQRAGRREDAVAAGADALRQRPDDPVLLNNYGVALHQAGRAEAALAVHERAARAGAPQALFNKGNVLLKLARPAEALEALDAALRTDPDHADALCSRAVALKMLGRFDEAAAGFDAALARDPTSAHARNNRGALRLLQGDFERGWDDYEARWRADEAAGGRWRTVAPDWLGESPAGLKLLVLDEQGHGDAIQFVRYLPLLAAAGADVTFLCRRRLHRLFAGLIRPVALVDEIPDGAVFDRQVALSSLPRLFRTREETIPRADSYLRAEPALAATWSARFAGRFTIGLCWQGNLDFRADPTRSVTLAALEPLLALPGVRAISLQRRDADAAALPAGLDTYPTPAEDAGDAFVDTAAAMSALDAIVTCDTSIAHLAGALGRPCFVLVKAVPDWRWMLARPDSPWYPSLALVRQQSADEGWAPAVQQVAAALAFMRDARPPACN